MGLPIVEAGYRVQVLFDGTEASRPWSTKFDYKGEAGHDLDALADAFVTEWEAARVLGSTALSQVFYDETTVQAFRIYSLTDPLQGVERAPTTPTMGSVAAATAGEVAAVVSLRTANLGRAYRGRQYWGGIASTAIGSNGRFVTARMTALSNFVAELGVITDAGAVDYNHSVFRRIGPDSGTRYPAAAEAVTFYSANDLPDSQRRRGPRG